MSLLASQTGGPAGCAVDGNRPSPSALKCRPVCSVAPRQAARHRATVSSSRPARPANGTPTATNSSSVCGTGKPAPTPRVSRPALAWSRLAVIAAPISGCRRAAVMAAVPTRTREVAVATAASTTNGSSRDRAYSESPVQSDAKPSSSACWAKSMMGATV